MTFYAPLAFLFLLIIPLIILLYLLKQRHQDYTVSSLYLWQEVLKDIEANAPWQKLRKNILMILQILAMLLLVFALSKPFLNSVGGKAAHVVIMMDTSMSMQSTDVKPSRFEAAKKQVLSIVSNLQPGTQVTFISISNNAMIEENLSQDRNGLLNKIKTQQVTNGTANYDDAAVLVQSIVKQNPGTEVLLFGDTLINIPSVKFYNFSRGGNNYAITLLSHTSTKNGITVLSKIANYSNQDANIPVSLYVDRKVFDARNVAVNKGETANVYWNSIPLNASALECRIDTEDTLAADNIAWDVINPVKNSKVLLNSTKNVFVEKILSINEGIELFKADIDAKKALKGYDLYIFDGFIPEKLPTDGNIMVFNPPKNRFFSVEGEVIQPALLKSSHPLFNYIQDDSFSLSRTKKMVVPEWGQTVLDSKQGPVIFTGNLQNRKVLVFGFDIHNSDIALTPAFPILITNSLEWLIPGRVKNIESIYPGQGIEFNLNPKADQVHIKAPSGKDYPLAPPFPAGIFDKTDELGRYTLEQKMPGETSHHYFAVNAPAEQESNLILKDVKGNGNKPNAPDTKPSGNTGLNLQSILLWVLLALLIVEWWVYKNDI